MKENIIISVFLFLSAFNCLADSAYRDLNTDYSIYEANYVQSLSPEDAKNFARSALRSATKFTDEFSTQTTSWSKDVLQKRFEKIRDEKSLFWNQKPEMTRRATWLYPDDGCWTRAAIAVRTAFQAFYPIPNKVFAFGNLRVKTKNSPRGVVGWWYHVAPIVEVGKEKFVLDPAIEWSRPLTLREWLSMMGKPEKIKVAICGSGSYSPGDGCEKMTNGLEIRAEGVQQHYLGLEWRRMTSMGRTTEL